MCINLGAAVNKGRKSAQQRLRESAPQCTFGRIAFHFRHQLLEGLGRPNVSLQVSYLPKPIALANDDNIVQGNDAAYENVPAPPEPLCKDELKRQKAREKKRNQAIKEKRATEQAS